jgi:hypothetical protein
MRLTIPATTTAGTMKRTRRVASGQEPDPADANAAGSAAEGATEKGKWRNIRVILWSLLEAIEAGSFPL